MRIPIVTELTDSWFGFETYLYFDEEMGQLYKLLDNKCSVLFILETRYTLLQKSESDVMRIAVTTNSVIGLMELIGNLDVLALYRREWRYGATVAIRVESSNYPLLISHKHLHRLFVEMMYGLGDPIYTQVIQRWRGNSFENFWYQDELQPTEVETILSDLLSLTTTSDICRLDSISINLWKQPEVFTEKEDIDRTLALFSIQFEDLCFERSRIVSIAKYEDQIWASPFRLELANDPDTFYIRIH